VEVDLRNMGVKRRTAKVLNREEWASIRNEATDKLKGLYCYRRRWRMHYITGFVALYQYIITVNDSYLSFTQNHGTSHSSD
jgi:uncharacterized protein YydD (DUF2326 family)